MEDHEHKEKEDRKRKVKQSVEDGTFDYDEAVKKWTQCCHFMRNKKRFCNLERSPNSKYCGAHRPLDEEAGSRIQIQSKKQGIAVQRCPCPIDPSHSIYLHNLEAHIQICNIKTRNDLLKREPYYLEDCNSGSPDDELTNSNTNGSSCAAKSEIATSSVTVVDPDQLVQKIINAFKNVDTRRFNNPHECHDNSTNAATNNNTHTSTSSNAHITESEYEVEMESHILKTVACGQTSEDSLRHAKQDFRIILQMIKSGLISYPENLLHNNSNNNINQEQDQQKDKHPNTMERSNIVQKLEQYQPSDTHLPHTMQPNSNIVYCELGAGKGMLGLAVHAVQPTATIVFVERSGTKCMVFMY